MSAEAERRAGIFLILSAMRRQTLFVIDEVSWPSFGYVGAVAALAAVVPLDRAVWLVGRPAKAAAS